MEPCDICGESKLELKQTIVNGQPKPACNECHDILKNAEHPKFDELMKNFLGRVDSAE